MDEVIRSSECYPILQTYRLEERTGCIQCVYVASGTRVCWYTLACLPHSPFSVEWSVDSQSTFQQWHNGIADSLSDITYTHTLTTIYRPATAAGLMIGGVISSRKLSIAKRTTFCQNCQ